MDASGIPKRPQCSVSLSRSGSGEKFPINCFLSSILMSSLSDGTDIRRTYSHRSLSGAGRGRIYQTNRGGDITYHGPGQIVGYPIFDLREWKRDVIAYVRALEQSIIDALGQARHQWRSRTGATGVWTPEGKICAIGVHISRWVTSHGFALNHSTDLSYFQYIVPCGLTKPVTSMQSLGRTASRADVQTALVRELSKQFDLEMHTPTEDREEADTQPALVTERTL